MFDCDVCSKSFQSYRALNGHKRVHGVISGAQYKNPAKRVYPTLVCATCSVEKEYDPKSSTGKYCSTACSSAGKRKKSLERLNQGQASAGILKKYLIETHGYVCMKCGVSDWCNSPIVLQLDHIDGNSDNNAIDNGRLLCPNCHSQTETYCGKNVKNASRNRYLRSYKSEKKQIGKGR